MTYATHQEAASRALRDLLNQDHAVDPGSTDVVLECREQALGAIRQRLRHLGDGYEPGDGDVNFRIRSVADRPLFHLSKLVHTLPSTGPGTIAPSDLLPGPPATTAESAVDRWRCVARELMLGTAELTRADSQPWTFKPEAGWYVVADVAETVEAVAALDLVLANAGVLPKTSPLEGMTRLLVAGDVARVARLFGTSALADLATACVGTQVGLGEGPRIHMVRRPEDFAEAQRCLTGFLRATRTDAEVGPAADRPGLQAARVLCAGQIRLAQAFAEWAEREKGGSTVAEQFRARIPAYQALNASLARLVEVEPRRSQLALMQQSEMVTQLRALERPRLSGASLLDLNAATHDLTVTVGRALRREGITRRNIHVLQSQGLGLPAPRVMTSTREPFNVACKALANDPVPAPPHERFAAPAERERLRSALDAFVVGGRRPVRRMPATMSRATARTTSLSR